MEERLGGKAGETTPGTGWVAALLALIFPGGGHLYMGRVERGVVLGGVIWVTFFFGILLGGHLYGVFSAGDGLLSYVFGFCNIGSGLLYIACWGAGIGLAEQAHLPTSEYGNVFLMVAGLLNYLLTMDAYDIAVGRKR